MKKRFIVMILVLISGCVALFFYTRSQSVSNASLGDNPESLLKEDSELKDNLVSVEIEEGETFGEFVVEQGASVADSLAIYESAKPHYDLAKIKAGQIFKLDKLDGQLLGLYYDVDYNTTLSVVLVDGVWQAKLEDINYQVVEKVVSADVDSSLYLAGLEAGLDEGLIIELGDTFQWALDFSMDVRTGDSFKVVYEERWRDGALAKPGRILSAYYINEGQRYELYYYQGQNGMGAYYDEEGRSAPKKFLKAPVSFKYISSGYSTNPRYVGGQYQTYTRNHTAIDYAASQGTPIRAVADGKVKFAGWKSGYGNFVMLRHDGVYSTNYGHMSKINVKNGQKVAQGQIIGLVGSTGFSTGPHLHYEMVKNGVLVNPLKEVSPPGEPIGASELDAFKQVRDKFRMMMEI